MEGRKEAFRMYLEQTGTTDALTNVLIQLYELKEQRPATEEAALTFMYDNLSNDFPSQKDYDSLLEEVLKSREEVARVKAALEVVEGEKLLKKQKRADAKSAAGPSQLQVTDAAADPSATVEVVLIELAEIKTVEEAKTRLGQLKLNKNCKSLLVKSLSDEVINDALLPCIRRGLEDPNILMAIYAAAADHYSTFKSLFDPIIEEYFGSKLETAVESNWKNADDKIGDKPLNFRSNRILRTRITCARSIAKFDFVPKMDGDKMPKLKDDVEAEMKLLSEDNVKGGYLDLAKLDPSLKVKLENVQLLFESKNKQLIAVGATLNPDGRAIFCNNDNNLAVWVNEEEHLKFIATGTDSIKETFIRLRTVVENCQFMTFKKLTDPPNSIATITFCPTFLGPAIHISTVIKLSNPAVRKTINEKVETLKISVKPTDVEDEFEITNKPRLNVSEFGAISEFITDVGKLLVASKIITVDDALARLEELQTLGSSESLLVKHCTKEICDKVGKDDQKTFVDCIRLGLEDEKSALGICAADHNAYKTFSELFQPILRGYYSLKDIKDVKESKWEATPDADDKLNFKSHLVLRSRIICAKSVDGCSFVPSMIKEKLNELKGKVKNALPNAPPGPFSELDNSAQTVKTELRKRQLLSESENPRLRAAGATDFSEGRAIFYSNDYKVTIWVNEEEHLKFIVDGSNETGNSKHVIKDAFTTLRAIVKHCDATGKLEFLKSSDPALPNNCCLTFCPTYLGPAIHISTVVKFPNVNAREDWLKDGGNTKNPAICVKRTQVADEFEVTNKPKVDVTEFDAIGGFITDLGKLLEDAQIKSIADAVARLAELNNLTPPPESLVVKIEESKISGVQDKDKQKTLLNCIRMGLEDGKLPVGIFAVKEEAYDDFKDIFEPILKAYYGDMALDSISDSDWTGDVTGLKTPLILQIRMTCARSIKDHVFVAAMSNAQLKALKEAVQNKLDETTFTDEVTGTFSDLNISDATDKTELEKKHLLFEAENPRLRAAGVTDFSERAIFYKDTKDLVIWVNEEEHLKFIATGDNAGGSDVDIIKATFDILKTVFGACSTSSWNFKKSSTNSWIKNEKNITFCPTFLGPAIHIVAVVKLEKAAARGKVMEIAESLKLNVKPTAVANQFEVRNKPTLNKSEKGAVDAFVAELQELLAAEKKLVLTIEEAWTSWGQLLNQDSVMFKSKPAEDELTAQSAKGATVSGKNLLDCIRPGLEDEQMGIYAVDADAYEKYEVIFKNYIDGIHGADAGDNVTISDQGWEGDPADFEYAKYSSCATFSKITCRRSFKDFPFIPAMNTTQLRELRAQVKAILEAYDSNGRFYDICAMDGKTKKELEPLQLWCDPVNKRLRSVGVTDFVTGRAVFVNKNNNLAVWVCEEDHLKFIATAEDGDIAKAFQVLKDVFSKFDKVKFARHDKWGWKTLCPTNLGSTIEATIRLELPKITTTRATDTFGTYWDAIDSTKTFKILEICGKLSSDKNDETNYDISNSTKFGTEYGLVEKVFKAAKEIVTHEVGLPQN